MEKTPKPTEKIKVRSGKIMAEIKTCDELKAFLKTKIKTKVKDATLAKELEEMFHDLIAYGVGDVPENNVV
jgi:hypothetical protein